MKSKKVIVKLVLACALILNLTACSNQQESQTTDTSSQTVSAGTIVNSSISEKTENKKLSGKYNNIKLGDRELEVPFSVEDLGKDYSISPSSIEYSKNDLGTVDAKFDVLHNDTVVLKARINDVSDYSQKDYVDLSKLDIVDMEQQYVPENGEVLSVNNAAVGDKPENVISNLGTADKETGCSYIYYNNGEKSNGAIFVFDDYKGIYYIRWYCAK